METLRVKRSNNIFFAVRHGQSRANVKGIICSNPAIATRPDYGLSEVGLHQAIQAGQDVINTITKEQGVKGLCIVSSDFSRALETAEAVRKVYLSHANQAEHRDSDLPPLYGNRVLTDLRLRERWFGRFDMQSDKKYSLVWEEDANDSSHTENEVESANSVKERACQVVHEYSSLLNDHMIVLVAHGDVLQILQTAFLDIDVSRHRSLEHLETAKLRRMS